MKIRYSAVLLVILLNLVTVVAKAQNFISITPNSSFPGQTLTTTITSANFFFLSGSSPTIWGDFTMYKLPNTTIYPNSVTVINDDLITAEWTIPANAPTGNYTVSWDGCYPFACYFTIPGGFNVTESLITGTVFYDVDSSLTQNGVEPGFGGYQLMLLPDSIITASGNDGSYQFASTVGNKTIKLLINDTVWFATTGDSINLNVVPGVNANNDFGLIGLTQYFSLNTSFNNPLFRCFTQSHQYIKAQNVGTSIGDITVYYTAAANSPVQSSIPAPDAINGNIYQFVMNDVLPGQSFDIDIIVTAPGFGQTSTVGLVYELADTTGTLQYSYSVIRQQITICAYDPNDKTVYPEGVLAQNYTLNTDTLDFLIRFQNTGNDTAFKVVIADTLNNAILDLSTFQVLSSSHPVVPVLNTSGKVTFTFDNILLPDSNVNEPASHGWVLYRCMPKQGLANNTVLNNTAYIYFDFNPPVVTNTTLNTLVNTIPIGIAELMGGNIVISPNPGTNNLTITLPEANSLFELLIYDARGRIILDKQIVGEQYVIPDQILHKGVHFYRLKNLTSGIEYSGKFIKL